MEANKAGKAFTSLGLTVTWFLCLNLSLVAQDNQSRPNNCEDAMHHLDMAAVEASKDEESHLIVIARLGNGERSPRLSRQRAGWAEAYLINRRGFNKVVTASGGRVKGYGRVELYVSGRLLYVLLHPKNKYIDCSGLG
jgi:hypothetical protein